MLKIISTNPIVNQAEFSQHEYDIGEDDTES